MPYALNRCSHRIWKRSCGFTGAGSFGMQACPLHDGQGPAREPRVVLEGHLYYRRDGGVRILCGFIEVSSGLAEHEVYPMSTTIEVKINFQRKLRFRVFFSDRQTELVFQNQIPVQRCWRPSGHNGQGLHRTAARSDYDRHGSFGKTPQSDR